MTAIRLDFSILWAELTALADPGDAALLVDHAEQVWLVADSYASQTQAAYVAERQRMLTEASSIRQGYVAAIFGQEQSGPDMLARIADGIGIDVDSPLGVAVALGDVAPALRVAVALAARSGNEPLTHPLGDGLVAFWVADQRPGSSGQKTVAAMRHLRCGLYCHRNTLMNRLRRFTEVTGIDPTIPAQAARLVVAWF